jgi:hypothetical protein
MILRKGGKIVRINHAGIIQRVKSVFCAKNIPADRGNVIRRNGTLRNTGYFMVQVYPAK